MEHTPRKNWHTHVQRIMGKLATATKASMILYGIGILFLAIIIFQAGILIGIRKGNYIRTINDHRPVTKRLPTAHGTTGIIISINAPVIVVTDENNIEKILFVRDTTIIRGDAGNLSFSDLKVGDLITVIGTPTKEGSLLTNFIRVMSQ